MNQPQASCHRSSERLWTGKTARSGRSATSRVTAVSTEVASAIIRTPRSRARSARRPTAVGVEDVAHLHHLGARHRDVAERQREEGHHPALGLEDVGPPAPDRSGSGWARLEGGGVLGERRHRREAAAGGPPGTEIVERGEEVAHEHDEAPHVDVGVVGGDDEDRVDVPGSSGSTRQSRCDGTEYERHVESRTSRSTSRVARPPEGWSTHRPSPSSTECSATSPVALREKAVRSVP